MHAVVVKVTVHDRDTAVNMLHEDLVPRVSRMQGFLAGYWLSPIEDEGMSMVLFDCEESAQAMAAQVSSPPSGEVEVNSVEVREVVASAA